MAYDDTDEDDLIGGGPSKPARVRKRTYGRVGRPTLEEQAENLAARAAAADGKIELPATSMFYRPVGVKFLADVFRMEQRTVLKKLMKCPIVGYENERGRTVPKWDFKVAAGFLVEPRIDLESWLASKRIQDLPVHISDQYWKAMRSKQAWEREAKHTWRDEDVLQVLGKGAQLIRDVSLLWVDELPDKVSITTENYHAMRASVADMLTQIQEIMVELPKLRRTQSTANLVDEEHQQQTDEALLEYADEFDDEEEGLVG